MNTTLEERKGKAIELMKKLDIYKPYIKGFKENNDVCFFEGFGGFWVYQEPEIYEQMKKIEEKYNATVYAITHEFTEFGELYDFLLVTDYKEEWDNLVETYKGKNDDNNTTYVFAYVWNKSDDNLSELGTICIQSFGGGIRRIG